MNELTKRKIASKLKGRKKAARTKWLISQSMRSKNRAAQTSYIRVHEAILG